VKLQSLVNEACEKSKDFRERLEIRLITMKKQPDQEWLMNHLISVLGRDYVENAARNFIEHRDQNTEITEADKDGIQQ